MNWSLSVAFGFEAEQRSNMSKELLDVEAGVSDDLAEQPPTDVFAGVDRDHRGPAIGVAHDDVTPSLPDCLETEGLRGAQHLAREQRREAAQGSYLDRLHTDERDALRNRTARSEKGFNGLHNPLPKLVQGLCLGVAPGQLRDGAHVPSVFIPFDNHVERTTGHRCSNCRRRNKPST